MDPFFNLFDTFLNTFVDTINSRPLNSYINPTQSPPTQQPTQSPPTQSPPTQQPTQSPPIFTSYQNRESAHNNLLNNVQRLRTLTRPETNNLHNNPFYSPNPWVRHLIHDAYLNTLNSTLDSITETHLSRIVIPELSNTTSNPLSNTNSISNLLALTILDYINNSPVSNNINTDNLEDVKVVLEEEDFNLLPQISLQTNEESHQCSICIENYEDSAIKKILPCKHDFHESCIKEWLCHHNVSCPVCRSDVRDFLDKVKLD
jgi:hypothetical protein